MTLVPGYDTFATDYALGKNQIVYTRLAADLDTPVSLMLKLTGAHKDAFVLESVTGGEVRGRYSIIGMKPDLVWRCRGNISSINRMARYDGDAFNDILGDPLDVLRDLIAESQINLPEDLPQAAAGLFGYLGYDMIRLVEHLPNGPAPALTSYNMVKVAVARLTSHAQEFQLTLSSCGMLSKISSSCAQ